jgi:hypothetical protein
MKCDVLQEIEDYCQITSSKDFAMRVCGAGLRLISAQDEGGDK